MPSFWKIFVGHGTIWWKNSSGRSSPAGGNSKKPKKNDPATITAMKRMWKEETSAKERSINKFESTIKKIKQYLKQSKEPRSFERAHRKNRWGDPRRQTNSTSWWHGHGQAQFDDSAAMRWLWKVIQAGWCWNFSNLESDDGFRWFGSMVRCKNPHYQAMLNLWYLMFRFTWGHGWTKGEEALHARFTNRNSDRRPDAESK